ncbi:MAG: FoF1 ATP synthase subunit delta/epsilon [Actinomycetota bacterium]
MATPMSVSIVSPEEEVWRGEAEMVIARSPEGEFAILHGHIPFLAALVPGRVSVISANDRDEYFVSGGFLEASRGKTGSAGSQSGREAGSAGNAESHDYHVIVLADDAEDLSQIDAGEARRRLEEAQARASEESDERAEARMRIEMARAELAASRGD